MPCFQIVMPVYRLRLLISRAGRRIIRRACAVLLCGAALACGQVAQAEDDTLLLLQRQVASLVSIRSAFTQTTRIPMFTEPVVSHGIFLFKRPDALRWEYTAPMQEGFALKGGKGFRWEGTRTARTDFTPGSDPVATLVARQLLDWITLDLDKIRRAYTIEVLHRDPTRLKLVPLREDMRGVLSALIMTFTPDGVAASVELQERQGGGTLIVFDKPEVNSNLDDKEFQ